MYIMVSVIGYGPLKEYSGEFPIRGAKTIGDLISYLFIPKNLNDLIIPVIGTNVMNMDDAVHDNDIIHLYIALSGG
jgi:hypothetical protein